MQIFLTVFGYFFSISFLLFGILILFSSFLSGVLIILGSFLIFPKFTNQIRKFFWVKSGKYLPKFSLGILSFILIFSSILVFPGSNSSQKSAVLGVQSSQSQSSQLSSSNPNFSSSFSSSDVNSSQKSEILGIKTVEKSSSFSTSFSTSSKNLVKNLEISTQNLAKSTETSAKSTDGVETVKPQTTEKSEETAENQEILPNSSQKTSPERKLYQVLEVVDGDTIKINEIGTLRLIGIDTPETKDPRKVVQCFGKEASENAKKLLNGQKVYLEFDKSKPILDKYQRTLAYVFREDGYFYNLEVVKNGFAHSYKSFPHPKLDEFNLAENSARNGKIGFWADNTCGGNTEQGVSGEVAKATVPPTGGTKENQEIQKTEIQIEKSGEKFIAGSCASLKKLGLGNFRPGDPNYTSSRDRDGDGVACEM